MRENTILVVVDAMAAPPSPALERAAWLAKQAGARLELFACAYDPDLDEGRETAAAREQSVQQQCRHLEQLAVPLRQQGLAVSIDVVWDHPFDVAILKKAAAHDYWLVAKDTQHHNLAQRTLLTNVDWHLIRTCPVPLLLVKDRKLATEPNVLAAVDPVNQHDKPAALDDRIFTFAADLARVSARPAARRPFVRDAARCRVAGRCREAHHATSTARRWRAFSTRTRRWAGARTSTRAAAHECLQQAAKEHAADFVVMGAVARRGLSRLVHRQHRRARARPVAVRPRHHQATRLRGSRCRLLAGQRVRIAASRAVCWAAVASRCACAASRAAVSARRSTRWRSVASRSTERSTAVYARGEAEPSRRRGPASACSVCRSVFRVWRGLSRARRCAPRA